MHLNAIWNIIHQFDLMFKFSLLITFKQAHRLMRAASKIIVNIPNRCSDKPE